MKKILYLTYTRPDYSLNSVLIKGLKESGIDVVEFHAQKRGIADSLRVLSFFLKNNKNTDAVIIGYDSPVLAILIYPFCPQKMVYNAVLSNYERLIVSRKLASQFSVKAFYYWLIDFAAMHLSDITMVESQRQVYYLKNIFKISEKKVIKSWIGVNEDKFIYKPDVKKREAFTVLFRGIFLPESGVEYVVKAAKMVEGSGIKFLVIGSGPREEAVRKLIDELNPSNIELTTTNVVQDKLNEMILSSHLSLGQLSDHPRLDRTIPHKAYESLAMHLPYLTASNKGILELLEADKTCITCQPANAESLAEKILWVKNNYPFAEKIAENGYRFYHDKLRAGILAKNLLDKMGTI